MSVFDYVKYIVECIEVFNKVLWEGFQDQWPTSSTPLFSLAELTSLLLSAACCHHGLIASIVSGALNQQTIFKPLTTCSPSSSLLPALHIPPPTQQSPLHALAPWVTLLSAFFQPGLSSCWQPWEELPPNLMDLSKRATPNQGSPPPAVQVGDKASICQTTLPLRPQPDSPVWRGVQPCRLFLQAGMPAHWNKASASCRLPPHPCQRFLQLLQAVSLTLNVLESCPLLLC